MSIEPKRADCKSLDAVIIACKEGEYAWGFLSPVRIRNLYTMHLFYNVIPAYCGVF